MAIPAPAAAGFGLFSSFLAIQLHSFLQDHCGTTTAAQASSPLHDALLLQVVVPLAVMEAALLAFVANRHAPHVAGNGRLSVSELAAFILCLAAGLLVFFLFVRPEGDPAADDGGAQVARALGLFAVRALPASAAATCFLAEALIYAHVGTGGNGRPVPEPAVRMLTEKTLEAAAALIGVMAMAIYHTL